jgi:Xaa-Pro dipeptidase
MLTAEGCLNRRQRLWEKVGASSGLPLLVLNDPIHLRYFANLYVEPFSLGADFGALLAIKPDGSATLAYDSRIAAGSIKQVHAEELISIPWYDGKTPGQGPRRSILIPRLKEWGGRIHDALNDPLGESVQLTVATMRRQKDPDEVVALKKCMLIAKAGMEWAKSNARAGMTELDVYSGIFAACTKAAGQAVILYGDFAVSPGSAKRGGPAANHMLHDGEMLILDFSVILGGYRSDYTNTLVIGGRPNSDQERLFQLCVAAMSAGERELRAGASCLAVYQAVRTSFEKASMAVNFPHHAGHGLGLGHPEAPFFVVNATETLLAGDVVTLEPGLYVDGVGGLRIEHNYLITANGFERLSHHEIALR